MSDFFLGIRIQSHSKATSYTTIAQQECISSMRGYQILCDLPKLFYQTREKDDVKYSYLSMFHITIHIYIRISTLLDFHDSKPIWPLLDFPVAPVDLG